MKDIDKILEQEYFINDIYKLISESLLNEGQVKSIPDPEDLKNNKTFYGVAIDKFVSAPNEKDIKRFMETSPQIYANVFGFGPEDDLRERIRKINNTFTKPDTNRTIPRIMNYLDVLTMMYKGFNAYNDKTAGFLAEHIIAILVGGEIPGDDRQIEDVVVKENGTIKKAYSLKAYRAGATSFPGSFSYLMDFFRKNPNLNYISYIYISKSKGSVNEEKTNKKQNSEVVSLEFKEVLLTPYDLTKRNINLKGRKVVSFISGIKNIRDLIDLEGRNQYRQRLDAIKNTYENALKNMKNSDYLINLIEKIIQESENEDKFKINNNLTNEFTDLIFAPDNDKYKIENYFKLNVKEGTLFPLYVKVAETTNVENNNISEDAKRENIINLIREFIKTGKVDGESVMTSYQTQFKLNADLFGSNPNVEEGDENSYKLEIGQEQMLSILENNSKLIGETIKKAYFALDQINDGVNGFFRGTMKAEQATNQTIKGSNDMVEVAREFRSLEDDGVMGVKDE